MSDFVPCRNMNPSTAESEQAIEVVLDAAAEQLKKSLDAGRAVALHMSRVFARAVRQTSLSQAAVMRQIIIASNRFANPTPSELRNQSMVDARSAQMARIRRARTYGGQK